jgi:hypothetical protein
VALSEYGRDFVFGPWRDWHGGDCPLLDYVRPEIRYRSGGETEELATRVRWQHTGKWDDVIAYRVRIPVSPGIAP